ncbi:beta-glucosidase family 9 [Candidatus Koribacter versatilis Ellin345]|uniref:Beta-glucosidase family 9 n=1 Tax=Koribacter versatilis (strain Ellin345) TaxID=204669 RepID=Q1IUL9_KORVE|nr:glycoside hydrolase family 9 protein [Candidatus Koribacter versatilis]ABF39431.1 beta-glucosidase family 9 [Candidatus Koribacter versatilis Ellin345]
MLHAAKMSSVLLLLCASAFCANDLKVLTDHVGYETTGAKHAVVLGKAGDRVSECSIKNSTDDRVVAPIKAVAVGPVKKWRDWYFWTLDFDSLTQEGHYYIECASSRGAVRSFPFAVQANLLEQGTLSDVLYYFKDERSSGPMDKADSHLPFDPPKQGTLDAHGGWWDATGDYGKHLSHLSFSTYFNPQQIPLVVYSLLKSYGQLTRRGLPEVTRYKDRILDEAMFGADYLVRVKDPSGSFYRSISTGGVKQVPEERKVAGEMKKFAIYQSNDKRPDMIEKANNDLEYEVSYRSGGGIAIAALAMASTAPISGEYKNADYLKAAEDAFAYLEKNNLKMVNDGKENIVDDYCALTAATELFRATKKPIYKEAADRRASSLVSRLASDGQHQNYWRADDHDRPFFHASDAGLPVVSLLYYAEVTDAQTRTKVLETVKKSLAFELATTREVPNPFGYAREFVQDKTGARRTSFFFPHNSDAAPWWQGENARLASLSSAARLAALQFTDDPEFAKQLNSYALNQLNWIVGLNPFDSSMLNGVGHNNPQYLFFDSWEFTNAPGGISNGITSGFRDEDDIDFNLTYKQTGADNDWRWQEQWLPHASWYLLAVSTGNTSPR